jgi:hypothetical protein
MQLFLISFAVIALAVAAMAVGVIVSNRRIQGSCGGLGAIDGLKSACEVCSSPCKRRLQAQQQAAAGDGV